MEINPLPHDHGHLSNDNCARTAVKLAESGTTRFVLGHLSKENNTPELAYKASAEALCSMGALENRDYILKVAAPENENGIITI